MKLKILGLVVITTALFLIFTNCTETTPNSYDDLINLPESELREIDIAKMNLLCAKGLPNTEDLDINSAMKIFDKWATIVNSKINHYMPNFFKNPNRYENSLAKFKAINLVLSIQQDLECGYNHDLIKSGAMKDIYSTRFFKNPEDIFVHGFIKNRKGSCSSLPVLTVAFGRKCGMPLVLVTCKGHLFCRWDDGNEKFNIEVSTKGVNIYPDSYYRNWPYKSTDSEIESEGYLKSLTPLEELATFSNSRATCFQEHNNYAKAKEAFEVALRGFPNSKYTKAHINNLKGVETK